MAEVENVLASDASASEEYISDEHSSDYNDTEDVPDIDIPTFKVGDSFKTFDELEKRLKEFESVHYVKFWKREARTVEAATKKVNRYINPRLKYYQLKYTCIHGGQVFRVAQVGLATRATPIIILKLKMGGAGRSTRV